MKVSTDFAPFIRCIQKRNIENDRDAHVHHALPHSSLASYYVPAVTSASAFDSTITAIFNNDTHNELSNGI